MSPGASVDIRPVQAHDLAPVLRLISQVPEAPAWTVDDFRKLIDPPPQACRDAADAALTRIAWIAGTNMQLLGLAVLQCLQIGGTGVSETECELESILVHPEARGRGLGTQLLDTVKGECAARRAAILRLEVRAGNQTAIRLYERAGFTRTGTRPRYYAAPEEDALLMHYVGMSSPGR